MPLLKKKTLEANYMPIPLPEGLRDDEEVFHCEMTNELFRDYDEFAERTILCNSMVWTCAMTGKTNLTYLEAVQSEKNAKQSLKDFPVELRIPVLYLANKTKRTSFAEMAEDVFSYARERYFVGENVEASFSGVKWGDYHILQVITPTPEEMENMSKMNGSTTERHFAPPPHTYKYDLEQLDADDDDVIEKMIVDFTQMRRRKGTFSREKCKLFLKQYVEQNNGIWCVKESALENFGVNKTKFDQIFAGPLPAFDNSKKISKVPNGKKVRQETLAKYLKGADGKELKLNAFEQSKKRQEELKKSKEEQKLKIAEEKQKRKEENLKVAHLFKAWHKPKDDLELEDQRMLPKLNPVETKVPNKHVGEMFMILEFVNSFSKILRPKNFFPDGFTIELMERALIEKEVAGPLIDLIQMLLNAIFAQEDEEATQTKVYKEYVKEIRKIPENPTMEQCSKLATIAERFPKKYHGCRLGKLPLYSLTVSEILRLHLLASGSKINEVGARWRYQQRGGYTSEDDPGLYMRRYQPNLIKALAVHNVVQLNVGAKLKLLSCLADQLLTYADVRDIIDERIETSKQKKQDLKNAQMIEKKRRLDVVSTKSRLKLNLELSKDDYKNEISKIDRENERLQAEYEKRLEKLTKASCDSHVNLGYDRAFRRYVKLDSVPGVFIDPREDNPGICLRGPVHQIPDLVNAERGIILDHLKKTSDDMNSSDKENDPKKPVKVNGMNGDTEHKDVQLFNELLMCTGDQYSCMVHSERRCEEQWRFISSTEELDELIQSLNKRGVRESELQQILLICHRKLSEDIHLTPSHLGRDVEEKNDRAAKRKMRYEDANFGFPTDADPDSVLQRTLIEIILEMEEKIFAGNLGSLKIKTKRDTWRKCLADENFDEFDRTLTIQVENGNVNHVKENHESDCSRESTPDIKADEFMDPGSALHSPAMKVDDEDSNDAMDLTLPEKRQIALECLSIALAQVAHAVEAKYVKKPLGHADAKKHDFITLRDVLKNWEKSLLASTSYSQIFLHYGTLDSCIMWAKSALLAKCRVCRRQSDSENMLLCDNCDLGYHLYCLKPKLNSVPQGEWFCPKCLEKKRKEQRLLNPEPEPPKKRRRIFRDEDVEDEEKDESTEKVNKVSEVDKEEDSEDEEDSIKCELCVTCGSGGELLSCEKCPKNYHIECIEPPLRRMPRGPWTCNFCKEKKRFREDDSDSGDEAPFTRRLNRREAEDLPLHNAGLQDLLTEVMKHKDAWPFLRPVQKNEVPDYYDVITKPMDFGTIKYKLNMGNYTCDEEFMADSVLVFENCNTYNDTDAEVYRCGVRLLKIFQKKSKELGLKLPEEMEDDEKDVKPTKAKRKRTT